MLKDKSSNVDTTFFIEASTGTNSQNTDNDSYCITVCMYLELQKK